MTEDQKHFKGQLEDERVICAFRKHWIGILPSLLILPVLTSVLILALVFSRPLSSGDVLSTILVIAGLSGVSYFLHRQYMKIFHFYLHTVIITDHRVVDVDKSVFLKDSKNSIDLSRIQDVQKIQSGLIESIFDFGTLSIVLSGSHSTVNIDLVPRPDLYFKKILSVRQSFVQERRIGLLPRQEDPAHLDSTLQARH